MTGCGVGMTECGVGMAGWEGRNDPRLVILSNAEGSPWAFSVFESGLGQEIPPLRSE